jgi:uncharacterized protein YjgD (DUF1641 family)
MNDNMNVEGAKKEYKSYMVDSLDLLYELSDAGLLDKLNGTTISKRDGQTRLYFFDRDEAVKQVIDEFKAANVTQ